MKWPISRARVGAMVLAAAIVIGLGAPSAYTLSTVRASHAGAIGGFNGSEPAPTLTEFEAIAYDGKIRYFIGSGFGLGTGSGHVGGPFPGGAIGAIGGTGERKSGVLA